MADGEILIEFYQIGASVKVTAVDPETLTEVSIVGPAHAPQSQLERTAIAKLRYVLDGPRGAACRGAGPMRPGGTVA